MSIELKRSNLDKTRLQKIQNDLTIKVVFANGKSEKKDYIFDHDKESVRVPFAYDPSIVRNRPIIQRGSADGFVGQLREQQIEMATEAIDTLSETGCVIISAFTGAGKTITALYLASVIGRKTMIMTNKKMLIDQWEESIKKFCPSMSAQVLVPRKTVKDPTARFFIANPINVPKFPRTFFDDIQVLIVDELHQIVSPKSLRSFFYTLPHFVIGLSATPFRYDSYDQCIPMFFGKRQIDIQLMKHHRVFTIETGYVPPKIITPQGNLDWNAVLDGQATDPNRNKLICDVINKLYTRYWLVLVKRVAHAESIADILRQRGLQCEVLVGTKSHYDKNCRVLIGTVSKVGVGFDNPNIDALFVATDLQAYFIQTLGRCMRRPDVKPIIVDLIDNNASLLKHFKERLKVYREHGGKVKALNLDTD